MIFVDTSGWHAAFIPDDPQYVRAARWYRSNRQPLLTTDYVVDETLTLLRSRGHDRLALSLGRQFFAGTLAQIYYLTPDDVQEAWHTFAQFSDKDWSFTDCTSRVVIKRLGILEALAFDLHFRQFGTVRVVPGETI